MINTEILIAHIPFGRENAVSRDYLAMLLGVTDREMRRLINQARNEGHIIINDQNGRGYYQSDDPDHIAKQYKQNQRRALSILVQQKHLRKRLKEAGREV